MELEVFCHAENQDILMAAPSRQTEHQRPPFHEKISY
jgi:hypothetical protein